MSIATAIKDVYDDVAMAIAEADKLSIDVEHDFDKEISVYEFQDNSKLAFKFSDSFQTSSFEVVNA